MKKVFNIIFLLFFLSTTSCGFAPILIKSNYNFSYIIEKSTGSDRVNSNINQRLKTFKGSEKKYIIYLNSKESKTILSTQGIYHSSGDWKNITLYHQIYAIKMVDQKLMEYFVLKTYHK